MNKIIFLLLFSLTMSGCSFLPRITTDSRGSTPQSTEKSKIKESCRGKAEFNEEGNVISCSRGYVNYAENYTKQERKYTFQEKVANFIRNLAGFGFWGLVLIIIFVPGLAGVIIGRVIEGTIGITAKALKSVVSGVQRARKRGEDLNVALGDESDQDVKKYIKELKEKHNIK